ncbi:MAG: hypothetical protein K0Q65_2642, partial [Clostridia bacterium]|nr:hypothetical protein [Clostridia bacterium]
MQAYIIGGIMKNSPKIAIIDYDIGNLYSVQNGMQHIGLDSVIT